MAPHNPTLAIEDLETFCQIFHSTNLEFLEAIVEHNPASIRELAHLVERNPPEVLENVHELADYGLLELEKDGQAKRPVVWYDEIDVNLPLTATRVNISKPVLSACNPVYVGSST